MKGAQELYQLLRGLNDKGMSAISLATVKSVDENKCTCVVIIDEMDIINVRLKATTDSEEGFKVFPKVGSYVLIQRIADGDYAVMMTSVINKVKWNVGDNGMMIEMDSLIAIRNDQESLLTLILTFIDICMNETHLTNAGPTISLKPTDRTQFEKLKTDFQKLLKK